MQALFRPNCKRETYRSRPAHELHRRTSMSLRITVLASLLLGSVVVFLHLGAGDRKEFPVPPSGGPLALERVRSDRALPGHLEFMQLQSRALAGNLLGDPPLRELGVLLPPSYFGAPEQRFP